MDGQKIVALGRQNSRFILLGAMLIILLTVYLALLWAPTARFFTAPNAQRIFYLHVPGAWVCYLAFGVLTIASAAYLKTQNPSFDRWALAAGELTLIFATVTLISGTLWMRAEWLDSNDQIVDRFLWDTRLSITLVMWFILASYFVLRNSAPADDGARLCAILGIFGFVSVPLSFFSARFLKSNHPNPIASREGSISGDMVMTMLLGLLGFTLLFLYFMLVRTEMLKQEQLALRALHQEGGE